MAIRINSNGIDLGGGSINNATTVNDVETITGTALTTNVNDVTIGKVLKVGDLGIGKSLYSIIDVNNLKTAGSYYVNGASPNVPVSSNGWLTVTIASTADLNLMQVFVKSAANALSKNTVYIRNYITGTNYWSPWQEQASFETGSFTPEVVGSTTDGVSTLITQQGNYVKIGKLVYFSLLVNVRSSTGVGDIVIRGLPYVVYMWAACSVSYIDGLTFSGIPTAWVVNGTQHLLLMQHNSNSAQVGIPMDTSFVVMVSGTYHATV